MSNSCCCLCGLGNSVAYGMGYSVAYGNGNFRCVCGKCLESTKKLISLANQHFNKPNPNSTLEKPLKDALESVNVLNTQIQAAEGKLTLLNELAGAFTNQIQTDILVKPGDNGPGIPAHKLILAARSGILKNMLESDECKAPAGDSIIIPELHYEELQAFLQFLYSGHLAEEQVEKHCNSLLRAAHKYTVSSLEMLCATRICKSIGCNNDLEVLEFASSYSQNMVIGAAVDFIVQNIRDIIFSPEYEAFAHKNVDLSLQITKALVKKFF